MYGNSVTGFCESCDPSCGICSGPTDNDCLDCVLFNSGYCSPCVPLCLSCLTVPDHCTSCEESKYLVESYLNTCLDSCVDEFYPVINPLKTCLPCHPRCLTCTDGSLNC